MPSRARPRRIVSALSPEHATTSSRKEALRSAAACGDLDEHASLLEEFGAFFFFFFYTSAVPDRVHDLPGSPARAPSGTPRSSPLALGGGSSSLLGSGLGVGALAEIDLDCIRIWRSPDRRPALFFGRTARSVVLVASGAEIHRDTAFDAVGIFSHSTMPPPVVLVRFFSPMSVRPAGPSPSRRHLSRRRRHISMISTRPPSRSSVSQGPERDALSTFSTARSTCAASTSRLSALSRFFFFFFDEIGGGGRTRRRQRAVSPSQP